MWRAEEELRRRVLFFSSRRVAEITEHAEENSTNRN